MYIINVKKRDIERRLREMGYSCAGGARHDKWVNKSGSCAVTVPRHSEVNEITAKGILKKASMEKDK